jgi:hypothetical protein
MPYVDGLPFAQGSHESFKAAVHAKATRGEKTAAYLRFLKVHGPAIDHDAAKALGVPLSSICSIRNGAIADGLVSKGYTTRIGPYGLACRVWDLTPRGRQQGEAPQ